MLPPRAGRAEPAGVIGRLLSSGRSRRCRRDHAVPEGRPRRDRRRGRRRCTRHRREGDEPRWGAPRGERRHDDLWVRGRAADPGRAGHPDRRRCDGPREAGRRDLVRRRDRAGVDCSRRSSADVRADRADPPAREGPRYPREGHEDDRLLRVAAIRERAEPSTADHRFSGPAAAHPHVARRRQGRTRARHARPERRSAHGERPLLPRRPQAGAGGRAQARDRGRSFQGGRDGARCGRAPREGRRGERSRRRRLAAPWRAIGRRRGAQLPAGELDIAVRVQVQFEIAG